MATYFTSDLHFGHTKVAEIRGHNTHEDMDDHVAEVWEQQVDQGDIVYVLGDISSGSLHGWTHALERLHGLPGRKRLINGNHDLSSGMHRYAWRYQKEAMGVFESAQDFARIRLVLDGQRREVMLSHFPYPGEGADHTETPHYMQYRLRDEGRILLHGHTHLGDQTYHESGDGTPQYHVGWDAHGRPVSLDEVRFALAGHFDTAGADSSLIGGEE